MDENDIRGVRFYRGKQLPPEGIYADIKDGKPYGLCGLYAALLTAGTVSIVLACATLIAAR